MWTSERTAASTAAEQIRVFPEELRTMRSAVLSASEVAAYDSCPGVYRDQQKPSLPPK